MPERKISRRILLARLGLVALICLCLRIGPSEIFQTLASLGWQGFLIITGSHLVIVMLRAMAWRGVWPAMPVLALFRARLVRNAVADCLPFSPSSGLAIAARVIVSQNRAGRLLAMTAATLDAAIHLATQLLFISIGLMFLACSLGNMPSARVAIAALAAAAFAGFIVMAMFYRTRGFHIDLLAKIRSGQSHEDALLNTMLADLFSGRCGLLRAGGCHFLACLAMSVQTLLILKMLGQNVGLKSALGIEALVMLVRTAAFSLPAAIGLQEAAYLFVAAMLGVPTLPAIALALLQRARDLTIGVPVLCWWRAAHGSAWLGPRSHFI